MPFQSMLARNNFKVFRNLIISKLNVTSSIQAKRNLNLQEYQSKGLMRQNGVTVQKFIAVQNLNDVDQILNDKNSELFNCKEYVVKAQVLAGGRGKGHFLKSKMQGGVKLTKDKDQLKTISSQMLNDYLVTKQTTKTGELVRKVMIAEALDIKDEFYLAILLDRNAGGPLLVASKEGGVNIEEVAESNPDAIKKYPLPLTHDSQVDVKLAEKIAAEAFEIKDENLIKKIGKEIQNLFRMFVNLDATQVEINPFGITENNEVVCFDAKIQFDENAIFRQSWLKEIEKENEKEHDEREVLAKKYDLNFVAMDGNIGCLVNGAGLAMATMDIIHLHGGSPANFLDIGGAVNEQGVINAFNLITKDKNVKTILVNIFGGIVNCELIAKGLINALKVIDVPLVVRLEGTNEKQAKQLLAGFSDRIISADNLDEAAKLAVQASLNQK